MPPSPPPPAAVTPRATFETLTVARLREAKLLLDGGEWDGAYYVVGYAVEFALKVKIIAELMKSNTYPSRTQADAFYKHDLTALLRAAGLDADLAAAPQPVQDRWRTVRDWSEQSRYTSGRTEPEARGLYDAIVNEVLPWIRSRW